MAEHKPSLTQRVFAAITGQTPVASKKEFIPPLSMFDMNSGVVLTTYETKAEQLRTNIGWVRAANRSIVEPTVAVELKLRRRKKNGDFEEILEHDILKLIESPHLAYNGKKMRQLNHTYLNLTGETYMLMVRGGAPHEMSVGKLPDALQVLPSHQVQFKLGKTRYSDSIVRYGGVEYPISSVIRDFKPDPNDPFVGLSDVSAASSAIDSDHLMQSHNRRMFANNARPGLVFNLTGERIDSSVHERLKQQLSEMYTGDGAFKSLVVENGEVKPYMLTNQDLDFLASREFTRDEILAIFNVSPSMLGMSTDFNRANMEAARYGHILVNVMPRLEDEIAMWNAQLVKPYDPTLELYFDSPVPEDVEAKLKAAEAGTNKWQTIDETRELYGLDPLPDHLGDQLIVPINSIPLARLLKEAKPAGDEEDDDLDDLDDEDELDDNDQVEGKKSVPKPKRAA